MFLKIIDNNNWSVGFCRGSRVKGNMSRVEVEGRGRGSRSRVKKCFFVRKTKKNVFSSGKLKLKTEVARSRSVNFFNFPYICL